MTTEEIALHLSLNKKETYYIPKIKNPKPIDTADIELPIDPYILGAWLGDGSKSCGIISNVNQNFWKEILKRNYKISHDLNQNQDRSEMRTIYGISPELRKLNLLNNKHIPDVYLRASYTQRLDLLRGLMDTDGYYNKTRNRFIMNTTQYWQAEDTAKLVSSLGVKPTIIKTYATYKDRKIDCWHTCFFIKENPFLIRNQDIIIEMKKDSNSYRSILSVELIDTVPTRCIEVDSPQHTFLAGYNMIPTHNTNAKGIEEKSYYNHKTKSHKMMKYPVNSLMDCDKMHYTLQLSFYAKLLQKINPEFKIKLLLLKHCSRDGVQTNIELEYLPGEVEKIIKDVKKKNYIEEQRNKR